ncbi:hypothetical protein DdX_20733 [Ditylenchus destructor]|uniref:Uncharacterized protein n=1 Tax=Ditylenchus destructor TaxID=166010 RepID=A0AAD4MHK4_9BILA|nr:hypothetical protein DdX_20733 [Ditylenchus destructor]
MPNSHKFSKRWNGPFRVIGIHRPNVTVKGLAETAKPFTVHMDKIKIFIENCTLPLRGDDKPFEQRNEDNLENSTSGQLNGTYRERNPVDKNSETHIRINEREDFDHPNAAETTAGSEDSRPQAQEEESSPEIYEGQQTGLNWRSKRKRRPNPRLFY